MKLRFTHHAQYRTDERGIAVADIKAVLKNPDYHRFVFESKMLAGKKIGSKTLEVVYAKSANDFVIITVYET